MVNFAPSPRLPPAPEVICQVNTYKWSYTSTPFIRLHAVTTGNFTFTFLGCETV
jgi:hypothetical protein